MRINRTRKSKKNTENHKNYRQRKLKLKSDEKGLIISDLGLFN